MLWPLATTAPAPLISGWATSFVGAAVLGTVIWAGSAPRTRAVGSPALGRTAMPPAFRAEQERLALQAAAVNQAECRTRAGAGDEAVEGLPPHCGDGPCGCLLYT